MTLLLISLFLVLAVFMRVGIQWVRTKDLGLRAASLDAPLMEILPGTIFILSFCIALGIALFEWQSLDRIYTDPFGPLDIIDTAGIGIDDHLGHHPCGTEKARVFGRPLSEWDGLDGQRSLSHLRPSFVGAVVGGLQCRVLQLRQLYQ